MSPETARPARGRRLATVAIGLAVIAGAALLASGPGTRLGLWTFRTGLLVLLGGLVAGAAGLLLGGAMALSGRARRPALVAVVLSALALGVPLAFVYRARSAPMIHDITTDTDDPPRFEAVLSARGAEAHSADYGGAEIAAQQRKAYPEVRSLILREAPARAFGRALATARTLGWTIVAAAPDALRIEATDTTFWFGFKDDVVIRVRTEGEGSRVDVRSLSRVGRSDVGTNARRILRFLDALHRS